MTPVALALLQQVEMGRGDKAFLPGALLLLPMESEARALPFVFLAEEAQGLFYEQGFM